MADLKIRKKNEFTKSTSNSRIIDGSITSSFNTTNSVAHSRTQSSSKLSIKSNNKQSASKNEGLKITNKNKNESDKIKMNLKKHREKLLISSIVGQKLL